MATTTDDMTDFCFQYSSPLASTTKPEVASTGIRNQEINDAMLSAWRLCGEKQESSVIAALRLYQDFIGPKPVT